MQGTTLKTWIKNAESTISATGEMWECDDGSGPDGGMGGSQGCGC